MSITPLPAPPREPLIMYVDGANLYWGLHDLARRKYLWLDLVALAKSLRPKSRLVAVRYFMAPVVDEPAAQSRQAHYVEALQARNPGVLHVVEGRYQTKRVSCKTCGSQWDHREEKETDVSIAVSIVADAANKNMSAGLIVSADSDLAPAVRMAKQLNNGLFLAAAFPPQRYSNELKKLMPSSFSIARNRISKAQLPDQFEVNGKQYTRPPRWA